MLETGKFVWNNTSAYLMYTVDLETGVFHIESVDAVGLDFIQSIEVGYKITLLKRNADLTLLVTDIHANATNVQCKAIVEQ